MNINQHIDDIIEKAEERGVKPHYELTQRENEILYGMLRGLQARESAKELGMHYRTVQLHRERILIKYGLRNTLALLALYLGTSSAQIRRTDSAHEYSKHVN